MHAVLGLVGDLSFVMATLGSVAFVVFYSILTRWWRSWWGRHIFSFMAVVAVILVLACARLIFGEYPGVDFIRPAAYLSLAAVIWWRVIILVYYQVIKKEDAPRPGRLE